MWLVVSYLRRRVRQLGESIIPKYGTAEDRRSDGEWREWNYRDNGGGVSKSRRRGSVTHSAPLSLSISIAVRSFSLSAVSLPNCPGAKREHFDLYCYTAAGGGRDSAERFCESSF